MFKFLSGDGLIRTYTIHKGNWYPEQLSVILTKEFTGPFGIMCYYDPCLRKFKFTPSIYILPDCTALPYLGFSMDTFGFQSESVVPVSFYSLRAIRVKTNLSINTIPQSNEIAFIPVKGCYGDLLQYNDPGATDYSLIMNTEIPTLRVRLTDQDNRDLSTLTGFSSSSPGFQYAVPEWTIAFKLIAIQNAGYTNHEVFTNTIQSTTESSIA